MKYLIIFVQNALHNTDIKLSDLYVITFIAHTHFTGLDRERGNGYANHCSLYQSPCIAYCFVRCECVDNIVRTPYTQQAIQSNHRVPCHFFQNGRVISSQRAETALLKMDNFGS